MEVILLQTVENVGKMGQLVKVSRGFARNYLLPKGLAMEASEGAQKLVAEKMVVEAKHDHRLREAAETLAKSLLAKGFAVKIPAKAGDQDRLYGSVAVRDIAAALAEQKSLEIEPQQIQLAEPIKELGEYEVPVKLHPEVQISVTVKVVAAD